ncbi:MAG: ATP-binding protein [Pseudomonadota bacterium]
MDIRSTQVNLTGLLDVLGGALYSTPNVAVRELVQNAHDSCVRRRLESGEPFDPRITVSVNTQLNQLIIEDAGAGLTEQEVEEYLATVGVGYTRRIRQTTDSQELIGRFGLGFLSAFFVADQVEVWTCSYQQPDSACRYISKGGERYQLRKAADRAVGTSVLLQLRPDFERLADSAYVYGLLSKYCALLDVPVWMGDAPINDLSPPWRESVEPDSPRYRRLAGQLVQKFEQNFDALCTFPITSENGTSDVRGLLWIQDAGTYGTSDNRNLSVFVRGMLVCDDEPALLPGWAGWLGGVIESSALSPTASRESLVRDATYKAVEEHIHSALLEGLAKQPSVDRDVWRRVLSRHNEALLGAALTEPKLFDLLCDELKLPTTEGDLTVPAIMGRSDNRLFVSSSDQRGPEEIVFRALRKPIILGYRYAALSFASRYGDVREVAVAQLGTEDGNQHLFGPDDLDLDQRALLIDLFSDAEHDAEVVAFEPRDLPVLSMVDRAALVKRRIESESASQRIGSAALGLARLHTNKQESGRIHKRYINARSPLIQSTLAHSGEARKHLATLLVSFSIATGSPDGADEEFRLDEHLRHFSDALLALLPPQE